MNIDMQKFVDNLIANTKRRVTIWNKVNPKLHYNVTERLDTSDRVFEAYSTTNKNDDVVVIGRAEHKVYTDEDEYYTTDYYFVTLTDPKYTEKVTFFEDDREYGYQTFSVDLARLYRLIKLNYMNTDNKLKSFFD
ncbi:hypothetical protein [Paenibacillus odorifer]|uniref:hypothetical protein n=1 Tax=Paenibacillus odorifer TaxID=189426 RepID=UPI0020C12911|nr:hypothetical protein [Paenibacillus odorifer]